MDVTLASWFVIVLAILAASLPFMNERLLGLIPLKTPVKAFWMRLCELFILYFVVGGIATGLEARIGNVAPQGWEFYAVTGCLFVVLAYPGFVFRYLRKSSTQKHAD
jgi:hypothetical protein